MSSSLTCRCFFGCQQFAKRPIETTAAVAGGHLVTDRETSRTPKLINKKAPNEIRRLFGDPPEAVSRAPHTAAMHASRRLARFASGASRWADASARGGARRFRVFSTFPPHMVRVIARPKISQDCATQLSPTLSGARAPPPPDAFLHLAITSRSFSSCLLSLPSANERSSLTTDLLSMTTRTPSPTRLESLKKRSPSPCPRCPPR